MRNLMTFVALAMAAHTPVFAQADGSSSQPFSDFEAGRFLEAADGAESALLSDTDNPVWWALLAESRAKLGQNDRSAEAFARAAQFESDADKRSYFLRAQALQLVYSDRHEAAREVVRQAMSDQSLGTRNSLDWAMVAIAAQDDRAAQEILDNETLYQGFTRQSALDAGYSAKRRGLDKRAVGFFETGLLLDEQEANRLSAQDRENIRREVRELNRDWSFIAQGSYSTAGSPASLGIIPVDDREAVQFGAEVSRRIGGWRNGKPFSLFARVYHSEFLGDETAPDNATQGWVGARYKPFANLNFNLEASRLVGLDRDGIDDWSLRAAISGGEGLEPEVGRTQWSYAQFYGDISYLIENDVTFGIAEGRYGHAFSLGGGSTVLTPYAVIRAGLDTGRVEDGSLGAGAGISLRRWFDDSATTAYRGFIDFDIQARERIAGDRSASGVLATVTIGR